MQVEAFGAFPNLGTLGFYRPRSQSVHLNCGDRASIEAWLHQKNLYAGATFFTTLMHEFTHWLDHVATLCGQEYLLLIFNAFHALREQDAGSEKNYWRAMSLHDWERRQNRDSYYTLYGRADDTHSYREPWTFDLTSGLEFDTMGRQDLERPILFARFGEYYTRELIVRQTITVSALWETSAVWSEILTHIGLISQLSEDEKIIEYALTRRNYLSQVYSRAFSLYSAPAHLLSVNKTTKDIIWTYHLAATLVNICLNTPRRIIKKLRHPASFSEFGQKRLNGFIQKADRGYLFAALCYNSPPADPEKSPWEWVDKALDRSGLPSSVEILDETRREMIKLDANTLAGEFGPELSYILEVGRQNFESRRKSGQVAVTLPSISEGNYFLPPAVLGDCNVINFGLKDRSLDSRRYNLDRMISFEYTLIDLLQNFSNACR
jgi:hypothetical protein